MISRIEKITRMPRKAAQRVAIEAAIGVLVVSLCAAWVSAVLVAAARDGAQ